MPLFSVKDEQKRETGKNIYYTEKGEGDLMVFLHSWYQTGEQAFQPYLEHYAANYRVIVPDLPGHGQSYRDLPGNFSLAAMGAELTQLVREVRRDVKTVTLVGASMGSYLALQMALDAPEAFDHVILLSTMVDFKVSEFEIEKMLQLSGLPMRVALFFKALKGRFPFDARFSPYWTKNKRTPNKLKHYRQVLKMHTIRDAQLYLHSFLGVSLEKRAVKNKLPTLMVYGKRDKLTPADFAASLAKTMPSAVLRIIDGAGHNLYLNRPHDVICMMDEFLEDHRKRRFRWLSMFWKR